MAIAFFVSGVLGRQQLWFTHRRTGHAAFPDVDGLAEGAVVRLGGRTVSVVGGSSWTKRGRSSGSSPSLSDLAWSRPLAFLGLPQTIDENENAAMLWSISQSHPDAVARMFEGLASPRMLGPTFSRGYLRHTWDLGFDGNPINVTTRGPNVPYLADFLDALTCLGFDPAAIYAATNPTVHYPYPSATPLCP